MINDGYLFSNIGIDSIGFHAPRYFVDIEDLAARRNVDPAKFRDGLMLKEMRLAEKDEDIISLGLKAGYNALSRGNISPKDIDAVFCGTETITYAVKSVSNIFAHMLGISDNCMTQDIYNACAGGTLAILNAIGLLENDIIKKALVISADISSYQIGSASEATQGSGAVAMVLSKNPRIATFGKRFGKISGNVNDFFRTAKEKDAKVFGHYSVDSFLSFQLGAYDDLVKQIGDFSADFYTFHAPFSKLPLKAMQHIILKRWAKHINNSLSLKRHKGHSLKSSIIRRIDHLLHDAAVLPEYIYLKLKEKGFSSEKLEEWAYTINTNLKGKVFPQLRVPMHFGNMYNAAVWAQIVYILENYARVNDTLYFGSYGSGATCISGLLKVKPQFKRIMRKGPKIDDFIRFKERKTIDEYEEIKSGCAQLNPRLGKIAEHELNDHRGFMLHFCDEGCIIPNIKGVNYCPKGHSGFHERFFPLFAVLDSNPINNTDLNNGYLAKGYVRVVGDVKRGTSLEYEIRRVECSEEGEDPATAGLLNWAPIYIAVQNIY
jgi:hydroxymethylglutaryl-CoA synthase